MLNPGGLWCSVWNGSIPSLIDHFYKHDSTFELRLPPGLISAPPVTHFPYQRHLEEAGWEGGRGEAQRILTNVPGGGVTSGAGSVEEALNEDDVQLRFIMNRCWHVGRGGGGGGGSQEKK